MTSSNWLGGPIAQMNWGRLRHDPGSPELLEFEDSLSEIYALAEQTDGFVWRIPDDQIAAELVSCGFDNRTSATVSVWESFEALRHYTFDTLHGGFLKRKAEWFEEVEGPQLVIWNTSTDARPELTEA